MSLNFDEGKIKSNLKCTSLDDTGATYLIKKDQRDVINFDEVSKQIGLQVRLGNKSRSCDALHIGGKYIYLIEFKNKKSSDLKRCKPELFEKAHDSIFQVMLYKFSHLSVEELVKKMRFVLVYNDSKAPESIANNIASSKSIDNMTRKLKEFSKVEKIDSFPKKFKLNQLEGILYEKVVTVDVTDFESEIKDIVFSKAI
jgi:hypothetical protein